MMRSRSLAASLVILTLSALFTACSSSPVQYTNVDDSVDFRAYSTFDFYPQPGTDERGYSTLVTKYFQTAIKSEMEALGYRHSEEKPDLLVNFSMSIQDKSEVQSSGATFGYYSYRRGLYTAWPLYDNDVRTVNYKQGTANVDIIDAQQNQLIWEAVAEGRLSRDAMENAEETIRSVVSDMFAQHPLHPQP